MPASTGRRSFRTDIQVKQQLAMQCHAPKLNVKLSGLCRSETCLVGRPLIVGRPLSLTPSLQAMRCFRAFNICRPSQGQHIHRHFVGRSSLSSESQAFKTCGETFEQPINETALFACNCHVRNPDGTISWKAVHVAWETLLQHCIGYLLMSPYRVSLTYVMVRVTKFCWSALLSKQSIFDAALLLFPAHTAAHTAPNPVGKLSNPGFSGAAMRVYPNFVFFCSTLLIQGEHHYSSTQRYVEGGTSYFGAVLCPNNKQHCEKPYHGLVRAAVPRRSIHLPVGSYCTLHYSGSNLVLIGS